MAFSPTVSYESSPALTTAAAATSATEEMHSSSLERGGAHTPYFNPALSASSLSALHTAGMEAQSNDHYRRTPTPKPPTVQLFHQQPNNAVKGEFDRSNAQTSPLIHAQYQHQQQHGQQHENAAQQQSAADSWSHEQSEAHDDNNDIGHEDDSDFAEQKHSHRHDQGKPRSVGAPAGALQKFLGIANESGQASSCRLGSASAGGVGIVGAPIAFCCVTRHAILFRKMISAIIEVVSPEDKGKKGQKLSTLVLPTLTNSQGIMAQMMDSSHISLTLLRLSKKFFDLYFRCPNDDRQFGLPLHKLYLALSQINYLDVLKLQEEGQDQLKIEYGNIQKLQQPAKTAHGGRTAHGKTPKAGSLQESSTPACAISESIVVQLTNIEDEENLSIPDSEYTFTVYCQQQELHTLFTHGLRCQADIVNLQLSCAGLIISFGSDGYSHTSFFVHEPKFLELLENKKHPKKKKSAKDKSTDDDNDSDDEEDKCEEADLSRVCFIKINQPQFKNKTILQRYSLNYLTRMTRSSVSECVILNLSDDSPLRIDLRLDIATNKVNDEKDKKKMKKEKENQSGHNQQTRNVGDSYLRFYLAPKMTENDEADSDQELMSLSQD